MSAICPDFTKITLGYAIVFCINYNISFSTFTFADTNREVLDGIDHKDLPWNTKILDQTPKAGVVTIEKGETVTFTVKK